jgi:hypothetical protein
VETKFTQRKSIQIERFINQFKREIPSVDEIIDLAWKNSNSRKILCVKILEKQF